MAWQHSNNNITINGAIEISLTNPLQVNYERIKNDQKIIINVFSNF